MIKKKPEVCDACLEKDDLLWDRKRRMFLCQICIDEFEEKESLEEEERRQSYEYMEAEDDGFYGDGSDFEEDDQIKENKNARNMGRKKRRS